MYYIALAVIGVLLSVFGTSMGMDSSRNLPRVPIRLRPRIFWISIWLGVFSGYLVLVDGPKIAPRFFLNEFGLSLKGLGVFGAATLITSILVARLFAYLTYNRHSDAGTKWEPPI